MRLMPPTRGVTEVLYPCTLNLSQIHNNDQGTLPFLSLQLLKLWNKGVPYKQTTVDNLESFVWVLVWCILSRNENTEGEQQQLEYLQSRDLKLQVLAKTKQNKKKQ
jgi:hypothetical protein